MQHAVFLNETARVPEPRFIPQTHEQYLSAVYTLWNLLDHTMYQHRSKRPVYPYGYMRLVQLKAYSRLVWRNPTARTYCETGVNGGHGTAAMLLANPNLVAHSFDPGEQPYSDEVFKILSVYFGPRFILHRGSSHVHLPTAAADLAGKCDVLLVDGDHTASGAHQDIVDFKRWPLVARGCSSTIRAARACAARRTGPGRALERPQRAGCSRSSSATITGTIRRRTRASATRMAARRVLRAVGLGAGEVQGMRDLKNLYVI